MSPGTTQSRADLPSSVRYVHPLPGAVRVAASTSLLLQFEGLRGASLLAAAPLITVDDGVGERCSCDVLLSDDGETLVLKPRRAFDPGGAVAVTIAAALAFSDPHADDVRYSFEVGASPLIGRSAWREDPCLSAEPSEAVGESLRAPAARTFTADPLLPSDYPTVQVRTRTNPSEGRIFLNNWGGTPYIMILENDGHPVFYRRMPSRARDFKVQPTGLLTYRLGPPYDMFFGMDSTYAVIDTFRAGHGYGTDEHELQMLPNGHVLLIALDPQQMDLSSVVQGGKQNAVVIGNHVQELDTNGNVVFEWRCWDHFAITDADHVDLTANTIDYVHMNAISIDTDGNLVISSRHLSELTKINRTTGEIMWRLGGKNNQFLFSGTEPGFTWQHDARALGGGRYSLFDNGNWNTPPETRVLEYQLDTVHAGATLAWQYSHDPPYYTWWMGNAQRLPNGNTLIGWADASLPKLTEVTGTGETVLEMDFTSPAHCYRVFKFPWTGKATAPYLTAEPIPSGAALFFPVFGDTTIQKFYIFHGTSPNPATLFDSSAVPYAEVAPLPSGTHVFRVAAVDAGGDIIGYSQEQAVTVRNVEPGSNLVINGGFADGLKEWTVGMYDGAAASSGVTAGGECAITISNGGPQVWSVQLLQGNIPLVSGRRYLFSFEAYAVSPRTIDAKLEQDGGSYVNYSKSSAFYVTASKATFEVPFLMTEATDYKARVAFNCGQSNVGLFFDNVSVTEDIQSGMAAEGEPVPIVVRLHPVFPNPFNPTTEISFDLTEASAVGIRVYNALGQRIATLEDGWMPAGRYRRTWDASGHASGAYIVEMVSGSFRAVRRILLVR